MRRFQLGAVLVVLLAVLLPELAARWQDGEGRRFVGIALVRNSADNASWLTWTRQAASGAVVLDDLHADEGGGRMVVALALLLGAVARLPGLDPVRALLLTKLVCVAFAVRGVFYLGRSVLRDPQRERWFAALVLAGGGLGFVSPTPTSAYLPETHVFPAMLTHAHYALAIALLAFCWGTYLRGHQRAASLLAGASALLHPYDVIILYCSLGALALIRWLGRRADGWRELRRLLPLVLATGPGLALAAWNFRQMQGLTPDDFPWPLQNALVDWGLIALLAGAGAAALLRSPDLRSRRWAWALGASAALVLMLHLEPFYFRRKLVLGGTLPLAALAMRVWPEDLRRRLLALAFCLPMNLLLLGASLRDLARPDCPLFLDRAEERALAEVRDDPQPGAVLCEGAYRVLVPMLTGRAVYAGYGVLVPSRAEREAALERFFASTTSAEWRRSFLAEHPRLSLIVWPDGRVERVPR